MRAKIVKVTPEFLGQFCKTTEDCLIISVDGVPEDARLVYAFWDEIGRASCRERV